MPEQPPVELAQNINDQQQEPSEKNSPPGASETASVFPEILPEIHNSDQSMELSIASLLTDKSFPHIFIMENFIQRFVATVDNLPEKKLPHTHLPIRSPKGKFIVSGTPGEPQTSSRNNQRYSPYVKVIEAINPEMAVKVYTHFYPLFQKAYEQLGYKNAYFNDRLVFVLDHLIETPNPADPLSLVQPVVLYTYADSDYENMSAGQKLLLRIGQNNRTSVLEILRSYRRLLTGQRP